MKNQDPELAEEIRVAEEEEQKELSAATNSYLLRRVVQLRVEVNRFRASLTEALEELEYLRKIVNKDGETETDVA